MKRVKVLLLLVIISLLSTSCVNQTIEDTAVPQAKSKLRIVATSMATVEIMEKLDVDLVGIPNSNLTKPPKRYVNLTKVGMPMTPDVEIIKSLDADYVFGPVSLISDLLPKYQNAKLNYGFLNLNNIEGMYKSIGDLGKLLGKEKEADILIADYNDFMQQYQQSMQGKTLKNKRVLILMGLPGSYIIATENSYVGSLVQLAGAENVYAGTGQQFLNINTEDMFKKKPDVILRTAHALPDEVTAMFKKEFRTNDIWKNFDCVKNGKVYDLDYDKFGMSAKFNYKEALSDLKEVLYEDE